MPPESIVGSTQEWDEPCVSHVCYHCRNKRRCMLAYDPYELHMMPGEAINQFYWCHDCYHRRDCLTFDKSTGKNK
jgi:hypothetical protein